MDKKLYDLTVDPELERVAPPLAENELSILKADILEHGCKSPLIVWDGVIVDGHNRYRICKEAGIPFGIEQMEFVDKTEAKLWIIKNQLGRRNLKDFQRCEMVLPLEEELKAEAHTAQVAGLAQNAVSPILAKRYDTRSTLAEMAGVSHGTLDKVKLIIVEADEETLEKLRRGEMKIHTAYKQLKKKENPTEPKEEKKEQDDKPPVVAAYLEGSMPFEPVQRDATPEEITNRFSSLLEDWRADMEELLDKLTPENSTEELIASLHTKLKGFYNDMDKAIGRED